MIIKQIPMEHPVFANCYFMTDDKKTQAAIVDPGWCYQSVTDAIAEAKENGIPVKYILFTHGHFDHVMGAAEVRELTGAQAVIHEADKLCLSDPEKSLASENMPMKQKCLDADITVDDGDGLYLGDEKITVMHTPGHTVGSVCYILEKDRAIFSGDTLFCMTVGRTDFAGGSEKELENSLRKLVALDGDYLIYPGHNRETTLNHERTRNRFIRRMDF